MKFSGFISYSHQDGVELTEDLYGYLVTLLSNFQPVYDDNIAEGNRLEKIKEKISLCDVLVVIITPATVQSMAVKEEIELAKELGLKIIPCKDKYVGLDWSELPWDISEYKGIDFENSGELKRKLVSALSKSLQELEEESEPVRTKIQSSTGFVSESLPLVIQTDKSVYIQNSDMICTVINPNLTSKVPISVKIFNKSKNEVYQKTFEIIPNGNGIYQDIIRLGGDNWPTEPGSELTIVAEHEGKTAKLIFFLSNFGVAIELDQKVYTWTDKVRITVVAPDFSRDPNKVERIGNNDDGVITIKTRMGKIENYELVETGSDTGIFIGELCLTGFQHDKLPPDIVNNFGKISGNGPKDGRIGVDSDDGVSVEFKTKTETITASALIRWNIGEVQWMQPNYSLGDTGTFVVIDPDMNLDPNLVDIFKVRVWSDSDPVGTEIFVIETGPETGIFSGDIQFGTKTEEGSMIKVSTGDSVVVEYVDYTLPNPYSKENKLNITGTSFIGTLLPPLKRIITKNPRLVDSSGNIIKQIFPNQEIQIAADLTNIQNFDQKFSYIVKITDLDDRQLSLAWITGSILSNQSFTPSLSWKPSTAGQYVATILVWKSMDDPIPLYPPVSIKITVDDID